MGDINFLKENGIDVDGAIEILGDIDTYNEILSEFLDVNDDRMVNLEKSFMAEDMGNYAIDVHAIKSDSKYLGFVKLADMALVHQLKSEENDLSYIKEHYDELVREVNKMVELVKKYLR